MTNEEFLKILPAYIGCQLRYASGMLTTLSAEDVYYDEIERRDYERSNFGADDSHKLILRPLSEMTESEYSNLSMIITDGLTSDWRVGASLAVPFLKQSIAIGTVQKAAHIVNYLRSIGIDCDGLIESGFAITNTK